MIDWHELREEALSDPEAREAYEQLQALSEERSRVVAGIAAADRRLLCAECHVRSDEHARGWRALLADDPRDDEPEEVGVYCPACAEREFGGES